jgi:endonuclease YncB( thermonuclease family)
VFGLAAVGLYLYDEFPSISFDIPTFNEGDTPASSYAANSRAVITDGDTIKINGRRIRFHGIDAPESRQSCSVSGRRYACGQQATEALKQLIGGNPVSCEEKDIDRYKRLVAVCSVGNIDLNAAMVSQGWALAYRRYSSDYVPEEESARAARRGIWQGDFTAPWEWRRSKR